MADHPRLPRSAARTTLTLACAALLASGGAALATPADIEPIADFGRGELVTINAGPEDAVLFEMVMPEGGTGEGYGRVRKENCDEEQPHAEILCDYAGVLGLATFATDGDDGIAISLEYGEPGWSVQIDLEPKPGERNVQAGEAIFIEAGETVATVPVSSVVGMFAIRLTLERFQDAR